MAAEPLPPVEQAHLFLEVNIMTTPDHEPHYLIVLRELIRQNGDQIKPGGLYETRTFHDDWCAIWKGGTCNCEPECQLIEIAPPELN